MTDREKLIALLKGDLPYHSNEVAYWSDEHIGALADHIIANGVKIDNVGHIWGDGYKQGYGDGFNVGFNADKWISVTEQLPAAGRHVLIYRANGRVSIGHMLLLEAGLDMNNWYKDGVAKFHDVTSYRLVGVTHWMPLPEPPMRKGENDG